MKHLNSLRISIVLLLTAFFLLLTTTLVSAQTPLICVDPGHGGSATGAIGPSGFQEKEANLDIGLRLRDILAANGFQVIMTRTTDVDVSLQGRCDIGNNAGASIFVSIHNNAGGGGSGNGTETYYWKSGSDYSPEGQVLASCIHEEVMKQVTTSDRGVKGANFYVLRNSLMPSALVEGAFIDNPSEEQLLKDPNFRQQIAQGVYNGILKYFNGITSTIFSIAPNSRFSMNVSRMIFGSSVSAKVTSDLPIAAERAMYFNYNGKDGGHDSVGVTAPATTWYLAEGYTGGSFDTWVLIQNPGETAAEVKVTFMKQGGAMVERTYTVAANSRFTVFVDDILPNDEVSTKIESTNGVGIIAERAMYFNYNGKADGHDSTGVTAPSKTWYLVEGYTGGDFDTWVLIQNPNSTPANTTVTFMLPDGSIKQANYTLSPNSRYTIFVDEIIPSSSVSTKVESDVPVIAERSMYFNYNGKDGGHNSTGLPALSDTWYFAEGYTSASFDEWLLFQNPNSSAATVTIDFMK